jgi:retron-type reverse transcriptase
LRVWIPKSNGGQRPLGIPSIRDRVVQMAVVLIIGPIFETDLLPQQYGFRPGVDARMAVRRIFWHVTQHGRREVVDADLRDYFTSIPHTPLLRSLCRRIADGNVLQLIKSWLTVPVVEYVGERPVRTTEARRTKRARRRVLRFSRCWPIATSAVFCWPGNNTAIRRNSMPA